MSTATRDTTNDVWKVSTDLGTITTSNSSKTVKISTANKYVDKDIWVIATATAPNAATLSTSASGSATISSVTIGTKASGKYPVTGSASISGTASAATSTSGYATAGTTKASGSTTGTASLSANITAAAASVTGSGTASTPTVAIDAANDNILASAATTTKPGSGYYAAVKATAPATTVTMSKTLTTSGYMGTTDEISASGSISAKTSGDYYIPITAGSIGVNESSAPTGYTENTSAVVPASGSLTIEEGYYPKTYIKLSTLIPNGATITNNAAGAATIRTGTSAYDKDGNLITGTMNNATITSGGFSATGVTPSYNSTNGNFDVAVAGTVAAPTVSSAGYIDSSSGTKNTTTSTSSTAKLAKVALSTTKTSGNLTVAPTLVRTAKPSGDAWTDAANGAATTTKPTSGAYIRIDAAAATNTLKIKPTVSTAGYGDTTNYGYTEYSASVGAAAATSAYVPIKSGAKGTLTASVSTGGNVTLGAAADSAPASGTYYISATSNGSVTAGTEGWISSTLDSKSSTKYYKLNSAALTFGNKPTISAPSVTISGSRSSNLTTPGTNDKTYYVTLSGSGSSGSVTPTASVSEGYVPSAGLSQSTPITVTTSISGSGNVVYLASTNIANGLSADVASNGNSVTYTPPALVNTAPSSGTPYVSFTSSGSATAGSVYNGSSQNVVKYLNVYAGDYTVA